MDFMAESLRPSFSYMYDRPWALMGDFNAYLFHEDTVEGSSTYNIRTKEFKECIDEIEVFDVNRSGIHFTSTNKQIDSGPIFKKLDRIMGNIQLIDMFPCAAAYFHPYRVPDHLPCILRLPNVKRDRPKPFKFANLVVDKPGFLDEVTRVWNMEQDGYPKNHRSRIFAIRDGTGTLYEGGDVPQVMVNHFSNFFGSVGDIAEHPMPDLFTKVLSEDKATAMAWMVSNEEIKQAMFSIAGNKAPGPDGYTSIFFKKSWDVIGNDICSAVRDFFDNGSLLTQLNHTIISLIPKVSTPALITDYRPISCCNTLYKCISKIITNRIKEGLGDIFSINQSAFVPGRRIPDNILLTQELMHNYHRNHGPPRCAFKVDIQKAYDTVDWNILEQILMGFRFNQKMIRWIMACVTSTISRWLLMEIFRVIFRQSMFHNKCEKQRIINLCFADDLFLFARGELSSAKIIMDALQTFKKMSGLVPSMTKSTVFYGNVSNLVRESIRTIIPFDEGILPVRYLGVPLISTRLTYNDCKRLVENMESRITDWKSKSLSFAGRVQLVRSVLSSMHVYWASMFILPKRIVKDLEDRMRRFLWAQGNNIKGKAKVKWSQVCLPKREGGLGIRRVRDMNNALMVTHIWSLITLRESLWVKWVHSYRIGGRSFWDLPVKQNITWSWRKMLQLRPLVHQYVWSKIGDGARTLVWFDKWHEVCPLKNFITPRMISNAGFQMEATVADMCQSGEWIWSMSWLQQASELRNLPNVAITAGVQDKIIWRTRAAKEMEFTTAACWNDLHQVQPEVPWADAVWFPQSIPRHSFLMWLFLNKKLKTQDVMSKWNSLGNANFNLMCCLLCTAGPDSHDHLFFECNYSALVWKGIRKKAGMEDVQNSWAGIFDHLLLVAQSKAVEHIITKLVVGAASYFIWQERNQRLFSAKRRSTDQLIDIILTTVRLKLHMMRYKPTRQATAMLQDWSLPRGLLMEDDHNGTCKMDDLFMNPFSDMYTFAGNSRDDTSSSNTNENTPSTKKSLLDALGVESFNWSELLPEEDAVGYAFMAKSAEPVPFKDNRTEEQKYGYKKMIAQNKMIRLSGIYLEAKRERGWDPERECYLDPMGNISIDHNTLDLETIIKEMVDEDEYGKDNGGEAEK
ncbi:uncharacterized protein LOC110893442 [Helianthus annuus]|uniref:uncharacterized protein LOC110893442 n=1 Tax=Helianthus annuus TaxID=4232 RepID=UPI001652D7A4|nr:uncharacterized protein LOC110893442 [Helianthus annuus]